MKGLEFCATCFKVLSLSLSFVCLFVLANGLLLKSLKTEVALTRSDLHFLIAHKIVLRTDRLVVSLKTKKLRYNCNIPGEIMRCVGKMGSDQRKIKEIESNRYIFSCISLLHITIFSL